MRQPRKRLRVLFLIDYATSTGGAERLAVGLAAHLPQDRFEPWMCSTRKSDALATKTLAQAGVRHLTLGRKAKWDVHRFGRLAHILRRQRFDVLHTHKFGSNLWGTMIGSACRVPVIVAHEHSWSYEGNRPRAWLDGNVIGRLATRFAAVSSADGERMVSLEGVKAEKVVVIPNGYIPSSSASDNDVRAELGLDHDIPLIAIAAVLRPEKRIDLLLEAHTRVRSAVPGAQLVIAGDGECRPDLERQAAELRIGESVHFLGARTDVDSILRASDVAALSSDREGSPLLVFECMANDTPLVATAVGGVPDVIEHGRSGWLVPRRDPGAMADGLIGLLTDPARRAAIAAAAKDRLRLYTIDATAERFAALYENLVAWGR
jgi:glycosyltransferase involved in cell wall biosynthesis